MIKIVSHENGDRVGICTKTQQIIHLPKQGFQLNDASFMPVYEDIDKFIASSHKSCISYFFCTEISDKGKRKFVKLVNDYDTSIFYNVERCKNEWVENDVKNIAVNSAYRVLLSKNKFLDNQVRIVYAKKIPSDMERNNTKTN